MSETMLFQVEADMDNAYAKLSAQELVSLLSEKSSDHKADREIVRRLIHEDDQSEMWGELLKLLVHRILYCINRGTYLNDLREMSHDEWEVVSEACVELKSKTAWQAYDGRKNIIDWLGGRDGPIRNAIRKVLNTRRKTQYSRQEATIEI